MAKRKDLLPVPVEALREIEKWTRQFDEIAIAPATANDPWWIQLTHGEAFGYLEATGSRLDIAARRAQKQVEEERLADGGGD